jgi:hypothetical protein
MQLHTGLASVARIPIQTDFREFRLPDPSKRTGVRVFGEADDLCIQAERCGQTCYSRQVPDTSIPLMLLDFELRKCRRIHALVARSNVAGVQVLRL